MPETAENLWLCAAKVGEVRKTYAVFVLRKKTGPNMYGLWTIFSSCRGCTLVKRPLFSNVICVIDVSLG